MPGRAQTQFGIASLMKFVTVCAVLSAFAWATGVVSAVCLALFAATLAVRSGVLAILALAGAIICADVGQGYGQVASLNRLFAILLVTGAVCMWRHWETLHVPRTAMVPPRMNQMTRIGNE